VAWCVHLKGVAALYLNEFTFRFNRRAGEMQSIFSEVVTSISETAQLPYKKLTA
jgi:hypothetical protein